MAPSITEILFELDLGEKIGGVTRFCNYPSDAEKLPKIGGLHDPNYEAIVALKPNLVVLLVSQHEAAARLEKLGIKTLAVKHETIEDIRSAVSEIGRQCDVQKKAQVKVKEIQDCLDVIKKKTVGLAHPKVLVSLGRDLSAGKINSITAAGPNNFYSEIIDLSGGENVLTDKQIAYPQVSFEGLIALDPDIVIDLVGDLKGKDFTREELKNHWKNVTDIKAVKDGRVYVVAEDYVMRPGPRIVRIVNKFAGIIHPEIFGAPE